MPLDIIWQETTSLATLIRGNEAIISAFNPGWKNPNLYDDQVRGTASIIAAIKKAGIKRVFWVGGTGGLEVKQGCRSERRRRCSQETPPIHHPSSSSPVSPTPQ